VSDRHLNAGDGATRHRVDDAAGDGDRLVGGDRDVESEDR
jgi:hypothetical protein